MRFPLSDQDHAEIQRFQLRSTCADCFFYVQDESRCAHEWPSDVQSQAVEGAEEIQLCKEFELL